MLSSSALLTVLRRGELLGLRWSVVDLNASAVYIRRSLSRGADSKLVEGTPKTANGWRRISHAPSSVELLGLHKVDQNERRLLLGPGYDTNDLVFANEFGWPLHPNTFSRRFGLVLARPGVPRIRSHDLRHTNATMMLRQGTHMKIVQERLGYADIGMTMNRYSHVAPDLQDEAAAKLELLVSRKRDKVS